MDFILISLFLVNEKGIIINLNSEYVKILGYSGKEDLLGKNISIMMEQQIADIHDKLIQNFWKTGVRRLIGKSRLVRAKHKEGFLFPVVIQLGELIEVIENQPVTRLIATIIPSISQELMEELSVSYSNIITTAPIHTEDWGDEDDQLNVTKVVQVVDCIATQIELRGKLFILTF